MAVVVKKVVECDYHGCESTKDLEQWKLTEPNGATKRVLLCARHARSLNTLWDALEPPKRGRQPLQVLDTIDDIKPA